MTQRKVLIGTPSYDGTLDVWYVNSLVGTVRESEDRGIRIDPIYMSYDALVQRARNDLVALALNGGYDDLIFIDGDIEWDPKWIFQLLKYKQDVVGGTYRKKVDDVEDYVLKPTEFPPIIDTRTGLIKVAGLGTGFLKLSRKALEHLWKGAVPYVDHKGKNSRMVFDIAIQNGSLVSEDILMCQKLVDGGFDIWLDPRMCCNHTGPKKFQGNFINWLDRMNK
jgi:glycosyltransferase involved in cell wall biosynthesis